MPFLPPKYTGKTKTTLMYPPSLQFKFLSILILIFLESSLATDTLTVSHALSAREKLISSGNRFELGFFSPGSSRNLYVGIWLTNVPWRRPVWVANRENQLLKSDANSTLEIGLDGNLRVLNGAKNTIWSTNVTSSRKNGTIAVLSEKGNLILKDNVSESTLWQSFEHPCDTFIAGMRMGKYETTGEKLFYTSWKTEDDPSLGDYVLGLTTEKPTQNFVWKTSNKGLEPHWRSGPWDGWTFIGLRGTYGGYSNGLILDQDNQQGTVYGTYLPPSLSEVMIEVVTPDGNINVTRYDTKNPGVVDTRLAIAFPCEAYNFCGPFGFCDGKKVTCECLEGFVPKSENEWKQGNWTLGCVRRSVLPCRSNGGNLTNVKKDVFEKMTLMKPPDYHVYMVSSDLLGCEKDCSNNCSCEAYAYVKGIGCLIWFRDLVDIERFESGGVDLYLRLAHFESGEANKTIKLVIILTTLFGVILLVIFTYCMFRCIVNRRATRQQEVTAQERIFHGTPSRRLFEEIRGNHNNQNESLDLPMYTFSVLSAATNNFGEENKLGAGGFGPVYKGKLEDGQEIAVKRLSEHSGQGIAEFKNEIILISKLKHRNLVTLLGYCIKGDEKLLVYEYLKNKSLDDILFEKKSEAQFDWAKRSDIIQGIARGILYLHRDSHLRVIHRDLKASNILLDDQMNPKISDFGLARGFLITQELANTHRVVGTLGYMSPEYALGGLFSEKSDVYSFGVLLLEIISGMKNTSVYDEEKYLNLLGYAWHLWEEGRGLDLMDKQLLDTCLSSEFIKYMQIGLLCVQDHGIDRPTMSLVVLMLTSDMDISQPKRPTFFQGLLNSDLRSQSSTVASKNDMSLSIVEGR